MGDVIALLRVSSDAQAGADRQGLPAQREACEALAAAHKLRIVEWVELDGVSGAAVLADPRFQGLLGRLADPSIGGVVAAAFDRVFRPSRFSDFAILDAFKDTGCRIYTSGGVLDPGTQNDALLGLITGHLAGVEREAIARRTSAGRERRRRELGVRAEGDGRNSMPRGVVFDRSTETPEWRYEYPAAGMVREAFDLFLTGETNLTEIGRRIGLGDRKSYAVRSMLRQPLYMGVYRIDRKWVNGRPIPRAPEDCYEHAVLDPPLVTPAEFQRVQDRLANRRARALESYEAGIHSLGELRKTVEAVDAERNALELQAGTDAPEIDESVCIDLAYTFARWSRLTREERRRMLEGFGIRFWIEKEGRGKGSRVIVARIELGSLDNAVIYNYLPA